jgi:hypothetical protein
MSLAVGLIDWLELYPRKRREEERSRETTTTSIWNGKKSWISVSILEFGLLLRALVLLAID